MSLPRLAYIIAGAIAFASFATPGIANASAIYYCNNGNCSGSGGNGDNGTNNGNNSSNNTVNVNLPGSAAQQYAFARQIGYSNPVGLPSVVPLSCGSRTTAYAGFTGAPVSGAGNNVAFGVGLLSPIGREPAICRPQPVYAPPAQSSALDSMRSAQSVAIAPGSSAAQSIVTMNAPQTAGASGGSQEHYFVYNPETHVLYNMVPQTMPVVTSPAANVQTVQAVQIAPAAASASVAAPASAIPATPSLRGTSTFADAATRSTTCNHLDGDIANFYEKDLRQARTIADSGRIVRDIHALDDACYHAYVIQAFAGH